MIIHVAICSTVKSTKTVLQQIIYVMRRIASPPGMYMYILRLGTSFIFILLLKMWRPSRQTENQIEEGLSPRAEGVWE